MENKQLDHKKIAIKCFNEAWNYLDKEELTDVEKAELLHLVHTSRYHWGIAGTKVHFARGEWQISRAYAKIGSYDASLLHANICMQLTLDAELGGFDLPFAYEAIARAKAGLGLDYSDELAQGVKFAKQIEDKGDRDYTLSELNSIK